MPEKKFSVFISHASSDQDWAKAFAESLRQHGQQVWLDREALSAGDSIQHQIETRLRESNIIVLLWNPNSLHRSNLFFEIGAAMGMGKAVVPVLSQDMDLSTLPPALRARQYLIKGSPEATAEQFLAGMAS